MSSQKPPILVEKGTIGVVSPGMGTDPASLDVLASFLKKRGHPVVIHPQNYLKDGELAGSDAARAEALMDMFADTTIDAIFCARGGTGCFRLLDRLDYALIQNNPKPFVGLSDITVLLHAFWHKAGLACYHGPMAIQFGKNTGDPRMEQDLMETLYGGGKIYRFAAAQCVRGGAADGVLSGGCLSLLQTLLGTPYDTPTDGCLLFVEDVGEPLYKIDRMLGHLRLAGKMAGVRGVLVGEMRDPPADETPYGRDLRQIVLDHVPADVPVVMNVPCGHGAYAATFPLGVQAYLTVTPQGTELALMT